MPVPLCIAQIHAHKSCTPNTTGEPESHHTHNKHEHCAAMNPHHHGMIFKFYAMFFSTFFSGCVCRRRIIFLSNSEDTRAMRKQTEKIL